MKSEARFVEQGRPPERDLKKTKLFRSTIKRAEVVHRATQVWKQPGQTRQCSGQMLRLCSRLIKAFHVHCCFKAYKKKREEPGVEGGRGGRMKSFLPCDLTTGRKLWSWRSSRGMRAVARQLEVEFLKNVGLRLHGGSLLFRC